VPWPLSEFPGGGRLHRESMLAERPKLELALQAVCGREGLALKGLPSEHAGGKWRLTYTAASGRAGNLELDVNYLLKTPLWTVELADSRVDFRPARLGLRDQSALMRRPACPA
jgi:hypothetical protein